MNAVTNAELFGHMPDGTEIRKVTITGGGLTASILNYGAVVQDLRLENHAPALVLGFKKFDDYLNYSPFFGATAGRCANRIAHGRFELDGVRYQLDQNFQNRHTLHGGAKSFGKRVWEFEEITEDMVALSIFSEDGEMGFPGNLSARVEFRCLDGGILDISMSASSDAPTLCNLAHHSYFRLDDSETILEHDMQIKAHAITEIDDDLIPTGKLACVKGTKFDMHEPSLLSSEGAPKFIDHNYCLTDQRRELTEIACLHSAKSGVSMKIATTETGLQLYDGATFNIPSEALDLDGNAIKPHAGVALEPQVWPDAINHALFPQAILRPGETYKQQSQFIFSKS